MPRSRTGSRSGPFPDILFAKKNIFRHRIPVQGSRRKSAPIRVRGKHSRVQEVALVFRARGLGEASPPRSARASARFQSPPGSSGGNARRDRPMTRAASNSPELDLDRFTDASLRDPFADYK